jgi:hypothetical protein
MHHGLDLLPAQDLSDGGFIAQILRVKRNARCDRPPVPKHQVIEHHRAMAGGKELANTVTADVTGSADDENVHRNERFYCFH